MLCKKHLVYETNLNQSMVFSHAKEKAQKLVDSFIWRPQLIFHQQSGDNVVLSDGRIIKILISLQKLAEETA